MVNPNHDKEKEIDLEKISIINQDVLADTLPKEDN